MVIAESCDSSNKRREMRIYTIHCIKFNDQISLTPNLHVCIIKTDYIRIVCRLY